MWPCGRALLEHALALQYVTECMLIFWDQGFMRTGLSLACRGMCIMYCSLAVYHLTERWRREEGQGLCVVSALVRWPVALARFSVCKRRRRRRSHHSLVVERVPQGPGAALQVVQGAAGRGDGRDVAHHLGEGGDLRGHGIGESAAAMLSVEKCGEAAWAAGSGWGGGGPCRRRGSTCCISRRVMRAAGPPARAAGFPSAERWPRPLTCRPRAGLPCSWQPL